MRVVEVDRAAGGADARALHEHLVRMLPERQPHDEPPAWETRLAGWRRATGRAWAAWAPDGTVVGSLSAGLAEEPVPFDVLVEPGWRRRGVGTALLRALVAVAGGHSLLVVQTQDHTPAGEAAVRRFGGRASLASRSSELDLAAAVLPPAPPVAGYRLVDWTGRYPVDALPAVASLVTVASADIPKISDAAPDVVATAAELAAEEDALPPAVRTTVAAYADSGALAGVTSAVWDPRRPAIAEQGDTLVHPAHRRRGLALWVKTALVARVRAEHLRARWLRTGNAASNTGMLAVNERLGFRTTSDDTWWELALPPLRRTFDA